MKTPNSVQRFFYIARVRDLALCGGTIVNEDADTRNFPIWRSPGAYELARRFTSVEAALYYADWNKINEIVIVNDLGTVYATKIGLRREIDLDADHGGQESPAWA